MQADDIIYDDDVVNITPFEHQVGGHKVILQISKQLICKPREESEIEFYKSLPDNLKDCVPHFRGEIQVQCTTNSTGVQLTARLPKNLKQEIQHYSSLCVDNQVLNNNIDRSAHSYGPCNHGNKPQLQSGIETDIHSTCSSHSSHLSGWSEKCLERTMHRYALWSRDSSQQFIVLENLLAGYTFPSILDMKLGRKQGGLRCSEEKRQLLESRCAHSTSASLGFRICGMQLFQRNTGEYISQDKYIGRALDDEGAMSYLKQYFHDGITFRLDVVRSLIDKLQHIHKAMSDQEVFRFQSVSLLLIYDSNSEGKVDARLIDFANAVSQNELSASKKQNVGNEDLLYGISSIIDILRSFLS